MEAECYRIAVEQRIGELFRRRSWYRRHAGWIVAQYVEDMHELRCLLRLARQARKAAKVAERHHESAVRAYLDTTDAVAIYAGWAPGELQEAFGR